jgi:hypothetical protein
MSAVPANAMKWAPRLASLLVAGAYLSILGAELLAPAGAPGKATLQGWRDYAGIVLMTVTVLAPLASWKWPIPGALLSLSSLGTFAIIARISRLDTLIVMAMPALLFIAHWATSRPRRSPVV